MMKYGMHRMIGKKKTLRRWVVGGLAALACVGMLAGCGGSRSGNPDVLKVGVTNFADTLEPTENYFAWVVMRYGIGETLAKFDKEMKPMPWLAKEWSVSDDHMTWTFIIDDAAKFSNGKPVTAEAVKASIERVFAKSNRAKTFFTYDNMKADGQTLTIHTTTPVPNMPGLLADPLFLVVDVQAEKDGRNFAKEGPIATGPYMVKSFSRDKAVVEANPNYWHGKVPFKTIEIPSIDDPNTRAMALQSGEVDMAVNIGPGELPMFKENSAYKVHEIDSLRVVVARLNQRGIFKDPNVRAALISATDRKSYADVLLKGTFSPGKAPIPPSLDFGFNELTDPNSYNPERAKQLLAEAGWKDTDGDGILDKNGKPLHADFVIYNSRAELPIFAEGVQADARKVGMDISIKTVDYNLIDKIGIDGDYDLLISNIVTANTGDPQMFLKWYWGTNINGSNPQNGSGYSNPTYDAKLAEMAASFDPAKRRRLAIELQQILLDDSAALFLGYPKTNIVNAGYLDNVEMFPSDYYWITSDIAYRK